MVALHPRGQMWLFQRAASGLPKITARGIRCSDVRCVGRWICRRKRCDCAFQNGKLTGSFGAEAFLGRICIEFGQTMQF